MFPEIPKKTLATPLKKITFVAPIEIVRKNFSISPFFSSKIAAFYPRKAHSKPTFHVGLFQRNTLLSTFCIQINPNSCRQQWPLCSEILLFYASRAIPHYTFTLCERIHGDAQKFQFCICFGTQVPARSLYGIMSKHREPIRHVRIVDYVCAIAHSYCGRMLKHNVWIDHVTPNYFFSFSFFWISEIFIIYFIVLFFSFLIYIFGFSQISCFYLTIFYTERTACGGWATKSTYLWIWLSTIWMVQWSNIGGSSTWISDHIKIVIDRNSEQTQ